MDSTQHDYLVSQPLVPAHTRAGGVTRLAPSPTGALHLGNARTFLINWAMARQRGWRVVLRIEDLDTPRVKPGHIKLTSDLLAWLGINWDEGPHIQSQDAHHHAAAMQRLAARGLVFPCDLTRKEIDAAASAPQEQSAGGGATEENPRENVFPRSLRPRAAPSAFVDVAPSWRFMVAEGDVTFADKVAGPQTFQLATTIGDFVVWTKRGADRPGQAAYQLAVVVDDARSGVTDVVRGDDLLESAARQLMLYRTLDLGPEPTYWHLPLVRGADGRRLAKRHGDSRLDSYREAGVTPERIIGLVAFWCGLLSTPRNMTAAEFQGRLDLDTLPRAAVIHTPELEAWLGS